MPQTTAWRYGYKDDDPSIGNSGVKRERRVLCPVKSVRTEQRRAGDYPYGADVIAVETNWQSQWRSCLVARKKYDAYTKFRTFYLWRDFHGVNQDHQTSVTNVHAVSVQSSGELVYPRDKMRVSNLFVTLFQST